MREVKSLFFTCKAGSRLRLCLPAGISLLASVCLSLAPATAWGQGQTDVLTDQQTEDLREVADLPDEKLKLYLGYIEERVNRIHRLDADRTAQNKGAQLHALYLEFTRICDELDDNLDSFEQQHADMRKALKSIIEKSEKWPQTLNGPKDSEAYDFVRKTALGAGQGLHDDATQMLQDETKYFAQRKKDKGSGG